MKTPDLAVLFLVVVGSFAFVGCDRSSFIDPTPIKGPVILTTNLPEATWKHDYSFRLSARCEKSPCIWSVTNQLPPGMEFGENGILVGKPELYGEWSLDFKVTDQEGLSNSKTLTFRSVCENEMAYFANGRAYVRVVSKIPTCGGTVDAGTIPKGLVFEYWQDIFEKSQFSVIPLEDDGITPVAGAVAGDEELGQPWYSLGSAVKKGETIRKASGSNLGISSRVKRIKYLGVYFGDTGAGKSPKWKGPFTCPWPNQVCNAGQTVILIDWMVR